MENRGFHTYYPLGQFAESFSLAYDLAWDVMSESERRQVREGLIKNFVRPAYETYVVDDQVTSNSSNWIAHIAGGALVAIASIYGDDPELKDCEPWLTGFLLKQHAYITHAFDRDGAYGEGFRYFNFAMQSFAKTMPVIERSFNIDFSGPMLQGHLETLWTTNYGNNLTFSFGDTEPFLKQESTARWIGSQNGPMNSWAWLVEKTRDPILAWLYENLKEYGTIQEVLHETGDVRAGKPDSLGTVKFFRDVGTAAFRSGWGADDFIFVFRSGPFYNHQHMDQGSFFLADHGNIFLEERYDGEHHYYDDPIYRTHTIQTIGHNTILIDGNPQSQKTGDPAGFAPGMNDQAVFSSWLDAAGFAFVRGDLERVYFSKLEKLRRNVLYIKPRTVFLVDEIRPADREVEADLLFHTKWKEDISIHEGYSTFQNNGGKLFAYHLNPPGTKIDILSEPHQKCQFDERPLRERGYLQVTGYTREKELVMGTLLTATRDGSAPAVDIEDGTAEITVDRTPVRIAMKRKDGGVALDGYVSDGVLLARNCGTGEIITTGATCLENQKKLLVAVDVPAAIVYKPAEDGLQIVCHAEKPSKITIGFAGKIRNVTVDGKALKSFSIDKKRSTISFDVGPGPVKIFMAGK
jgi:hypothetical protein